VLNHFSIDEGKKRRSRRMDVLMQSEFGVVVKQIASLYTNGVCARTYIFASDASLKKRASAGGAN
jgi:hypothetical protein